MRASIRGSKRSVTVTDSEASAPPAMAASMSRRSGRFSAQNVTSATSLSKRGTSSQLAKVCMANFDEFISRADSLCQWLFHFALVEEPFLWHERPHQQHPN